MGVTLAWAGSAIRAVTSGHLLPPAATCLLLAGINPSSQSPEMDREYAVLYRGPAVLIVTFCKSETYKETIKEKSTILPAVLVLVPFVEQYVSDLPNARTYRCTVFYLDLTPEIRNADNIKQRASTDVDSFKPKGAKGGRIEYSTVRTVG